MALSRDQKKGRHELRRKRNRQRMRKHKWTLEGKIGPEGKDLPHHHAWTKPETKRQEQARLAKGLADAIHSNSDQAPETKTEAV